MRNVLALSAPQPSTGWGFRISKRIALAMLMVAAIGVAVPAHAATVSMTLRIAAGGNPGAVKTCPVSVPAGANGKAVLDAAVASRCITSYQTNSGGAYLTCIDPGAAPVCEVGDGLVTFWAIYVDGRTAEQGILGFSAAQGRQLTFAYTSWLACAATYPNCV